MEEPDGRLLLLQAPGKDRGLTSNQRLSWQSGDIGMRDKSRPSKKKKKKKKRKAHHFCDAVQQVFNPILCNEPIY